MLSQSRTDISFLGLPNSYISPTPHHIAMSSNKESSTMQTTLHDKDAWLLRVVEIQLLHEATLQDLIRTRNYAVEQLLYERNQLLQER